VTIRFDVSHRLTEPAGIGVVELVHSGWDRDETAKHNFNVIGLTIGVFAVLIGCGQAIQNTINHSL